MITRNTNVHEFNFYHTMSDKPEIHSIIFILSLIFRKVMSKNNTKMGWNFPSRFWAIPNSLNMEKLWPWKVWLWIVWAVKKRLMITFVVAFEMISNLMCAGTFMAFYKGQTKNTTRLSNVIEMLSNGSPKTFKFYEIYPYFKFKCGTWKDTRLVKWFSSLW